MAQGCPRAFVAADSCGLQLLLDDDLAATTAASTLFGKLH
jgi:hypothetical protein